MKMPAGLAAIASVNIVALLFAAAGILVLPLAYAVHCGLNDCCLRQLDGQRQRRLVRLLVWPLGIRQVLSDAECFFR